MKQLSTWIPLFFVVFAGCSKKPDNACPPGSPGASGYVIADDVLMVADPADGLEPEACAAFAWTDTVTLLDANDSLSVAWADGKTVEGCDGIQILRFEMARNAIAFKYTMVLRPSSDTNRVHCMKGYGCPNWEGFVWPISDGRHFNHTMLHFRVYLSGLQGILIKNDTTTPLIVRINPPPG